MLRISALLLVAVFCHRGNFQETNNITLLTIIYNTNLNSSISLEKEDRELRSSWTVETQVKRINLTTKYRLQMTRYKEHSFERPDLNGKWSECLYLHRRQIRKASKDYYTDESECLTAAALADKDNTKSVQQVENEIRKWRKGYRYLVSTCKANNPEDAEAVGVCLVEYMERDNYSQVIQRLIILKLQAMDHFYLHLSSGLTDFEECLKAQLSAFLEKVRQTMDALNTCYSLKR